MRDFTPQNLPKLEHSGVPKIAPQPPLDHPHLYLEIGCGTGDHSLSFANFNSDKHIIAIERTTNKFNKFLNKYKKFKLSNLTPVHADAILWSSQFIKPESLEGCFILYPNPYPKKKQANLRWHNMPYFQHLITLLKPNAKIVMATNIESYATELKQTILENYSPKLSIERFSSIDIREHSPRTAFEKKYLERGETCFDIVLNVLN